MRSHKQVSKSRKIESKLKKSFCECFKALKNFNVIFRMH